MNLYVVADDGCPARYRGVIRAASTPLLLYARLAARFSVETADGVTAMAVVTFGALVALGRPFPLISLIDTPRILLRARCRSARECGFSSRANGALDRTAPLDSRTRGDDATSSSGMYRSSRDSFVRRKPIEGSASANAIARFVTREKRRRFARIG